MRGNQEFSVYVNQVADGYFHSQECVMLDPGWGQTWCYSAFEYMGFTACPVCVPLDFLFADTPGDSAVSLLPDDWSE